MCAVKNSDLIWCSVPGGVIGIPFDEMNRIIKEYNKEYYKFSDFWSYAQWELNLSVSSFSHLWNKGNRLFSQLHIIRKQKEIENNEYDSKIY